MTTLDVIFVAVAVLALILAGLLMWDALVRHVHALDDQSEAGTDSQNAETRNG